MSTCFDHRRLTRKATTSSWWKLVSAEAPCGALSRAQPNREHEDPGPARRISVGSANRCRHSTRGGPDRKPVHRGRHPGADSPCRTRRPRQPMQGLRLPEPQGGRQQGARRGTLFGCSCDCLRQDHRRRSKPDQSGHRRLVIGRGAGGQDPIHAESLQRVQTARLGSCAFWKRERHPNVE